ncbi:MAG: recombination protein O N-terminal domain-containing protein [Bacteroidia bacterium]|nr:recombination protein O N-terminal domain-containing protein [Bacteroidia bacterium]
MSQEVKTRAIVFQTYPYKEQSRILRLHTEHEGTLSALALGKMQKVSLTGALVQVRLRMRSQREVQRIAEMEWDYVYRTLFHDPRRHPYLLLAVEWLSRCLVAPDPVLFQWVRAQLIRLDEAPDMESHLRGVFGELLARWGVGAPLSAASLREVEGLYRQAFPDWKPLRTLSLIETLSLLTYDRG